MSDNVVVGGVIQVRSEDAPEYVVGGFPRTFVAAPAVEELSIEELEEERMRLSIELGQQLAEIWRLQTALADLVRADDGLLRALDTLPVYVKTAAKAQAAALAKAREALRVRE